MIFNNNSTRGHTGSLLVYYYSSLVRKNLSSKCDEFLAVRSQFDSDHRVCIYAHTCCQSAISGPLFAFYYPLFFTEKIINNVAFRQMRCLRCTFCIRCRHRSTPNQLLDGDTVDAERLRFSKWEPPNVATSWGFEGRQRGTGRRPGANNM